MAAFRVFFAARVLSVIFPLLVLLVMPSESSRASEPSGTIAAREKFEAAYDAFDDVQKDKFARILTGHSIIQSVSYTLKTVEKAVESCQKHHPDLKSDFKGAWKSLKKDAHPILQKAKKALRRTIALQETLPKKEMLAHLKAFDEQALGAASKVEPLPVERLDDCQKLLKQLKTEQDTHRLQKTLNEAFGF